MSSDDEFALDFSDVEPVSKPKPKPATPSKPTPAKKRKPEESSSEEEDVVSDSSVEEVVVARKTPGARPQRAAATNRKVTVEDSDSDASNFSEESEESEDSDSDEDDEPVKTPAKGKRAPAKPKAKSPATPKVKSSPSAPAAAARKPGGEVLSFKSPAEFFAENQNIAGFDNPGKAMYTTIREFVENSLDAAESIGRLPDIEVTIEELTQDEFNKSRGISGTTRVDHKLYAAPKGNATAAAATAAGGDGATEEPPPSAKKAGRSAEAMFYRIVCKDNGCGLRHDVIPNAFGVVLAGSKYGVRQTRGKFGLGAKMALIWSRKSTGLPIEIRTAYSSSGDAAPPAEMSYCKLDIDIYKNKPNVLQHIKLGNSVGWVGTEISVFISGNWSTYKSRVLSYLTQLAIITPYAQFDLRFICQASASKNFNLRFTRRSLTMPPPAEEIKHHPSAVNDLLIKQLIDNSPNLSLPKFFTSQLSSIDLPLAKRLVAELGDGFEESDTVAKLTPNQIHQIVALFRVAKFPAPRGTCLSPAGEYNLRLGIMKEVLPELVATHSEAAAVFEGHPFIVEAGVAIGGKRAREGITVYRYANRIPLLFEAGGDVVTRTALKRIKWASYKMDHKRDKIGVFVSIVSTKIPFKGTGKEYIGDDVEEIATAVKRALMSCCNQLRVKLQHRSDVSNRASRRKELFKYIPDTARAIHGVLQEIKRRKTGAEPATGSIAEQELLKGLSTGAITESILSQRLKEAVEKADVEAALEHAAASGRSKANIEPLYIRPRFDTDGSAITFKHKLFSFQLAPACELKVEE